MSRGMERANAVRHSTANQTGKLVEFDGDDPSIRRMYEDELARKGISPVNFEVAANND